LIGINVRHQPFSQLFVEVSMNRKKLLAIALVLPLLALTSFAVSAGEGEKEEAVLNVKLSVRGMTCAGCVDKVQAALKKIEGVEEAMVDLDKNMAKVTYKKGSTTPEKLAKAVSEAGFKCEVKMEVEKEEKKG